MAKTDGACAWVAPPAHGWTSQKAMGWKTLEGELWGAAADEWAATGAPRPQCVGATRGCVSRAGRRLSSGSSTYCCLAAKSDYLRGHVGEPIPTTKRKNGVTCRRNWRAFGAGPVAGGLGTGGVAERLLNGETLGRHCSGVTWHWALSRRRVCVGDKVGDGG